MRGIAIHLSVLLVLASVACAGEGGEKLLQGFEKAEQEKAAAACKWLIIEKGEDGGERFREKHSAPTYSWLCHNPPFRAVMGIGKGEATEGEYAIKQVFPLVRPRPRRPRGDTQRNQAIFTTYGGTGNFYDSFLPRDWSGYALLRLDVRVDRPETGKETNLVLNFADDVLDPPLWRQYKIPSGKWVTLEADLEGAVKDRALALDAMSHLLLWVAPEQTFKDGTTGRRGEVTTYYVDNIRLAPRGAAAKLPVIKDERAYEVELPRAYAVEYDVVKDKRGRASIGWKVAPMDMPEPAKLERAPAPAKLEAPVVIDLAAYKELDIDRLGKLTLGEELAAFDSQRIIVPFRCTIRERWFPAHDPGVTFVLATTDGGATWKGLDGEARPFPFTISHHRPGFCVGVGGEMFVFSDFGCQGIGHSYPSDKGFVRRTVATKDGWWVSPYYFVDPHQHHCIDHQIAVRAPSGRLWNVWTNTWYRGENAVCAKYSDDGGRTWRAPVAPGSVPCVPGTFAGVSDIVPYGEEIAVFVRAGGNKAVWNVFDGKKWTGAKKCPGPYRLRVVSTGAKEIYMVAKDGVWRWDGKDWKKEITLPVPSRASPNQLAVCGESLLCFHLDETKKKILCRRRAGNIWSAPVAIATEETEIEGFVTQRYAPPGFAPVAYIAKESAEVIEALIKKGVIKRKARQSRPWIKLLKVPAR